MTSAPVEVVEFTDPGCVWSWSSEPKLRWLRHRYGGALRWRRAFGVQIDALARTHPGTDPIGAAEEFRAGWLEVAAVTGAPVAQRLERIHVSSLPASLAARAAERQGAWRAEAVLRRLREAVFVAGRPPDTSARIADAVAGVAGLDVVRLIGDLEARDVVASVAADRAEARRPHPLVVGLAGDGPHPGAARADGDELRYAFPTLLIRGPAGERVLPGWRELAEYAHAIEAVAPALADLAPRPLHPDAALARYRSLGALDLELLTGGDEPPGDAVRVDTATTSLWLHPEEARARGLTAPQGVAG